MSNRQFESHVLGVESLPFILHFDIRTESYVSGHNWHPNIEILYFVEGGGSVQIGEMAIPVSKGDIVIVNSDLLHSFDAHNI
ncbi:MAG: cupin domain-containing protein, partial [Clostridia bacterium]|nr:cupin domain-containing protein [Clostridia bacterium]